MTIIDAATTKTRKAKVQKGVVVVYIRCSTTEQKLSPDAQRAEIAAYAAKNGLTVAAEYIEQGVSGAAEISDRPQLVAAMNAVQANKAEGLLVLRQDRLARDAKVAGFVEYALAKGGAKVITADGSSDDSSPFAGMIRAMQVAMAEQERKLISTRTKAALSTLKGQGKRVSRFAPYGYSFTDDGQRVEHSQEQAVIATVKQLAGEGKGATEISRILSGKGIVNRNGRVFSPVTMYQLMKKLGVL